MAPLVQRLQDHRHLALLIITIVGLLVQPAVHAKYVGAIVIEALAYTLLVAVFLAIFERPTERRVGLMIGIPAVTANVVGYALTNAGQRTALLIFHSLTVVFLSFAIGVILRGVFRSRRIGAEQILGGICGYLLAGVAWSNLYLVIYLIRPDAFNIATQLISQLAEPQSRRFLFDYFSFITLSTVGYGDISPLAPAACSAAWLEAMFGQFYMAVLIGQLIGLKLAQGQIPTK